VADRQEDRGNAVIPASRSRLFGVTLVVMALMITLGVRLWYVQVKHHVGYVALANQDRIRDVIQPSVRGEILSDNGTPLVTDASSLVIAVNMAQVGQEADGGTAELNRLAALLGISDKTMRQKVRLCTVGVPQPCWQGSPYQPIPVAEDVPDRLALQVLESKKSFPGVSADVQPVVHYDEPAATAMSQVLGYLQPITAQEVKQLHIPVTGFSGVDLVGQSGLEEQYDKQLRGTAGVDEVAVNAAGQVTNTIKDNKPVAGDDLVTSINANVQQATQTALRNAVQAAQAAGNSDATSGAAVVETTSGRIVAMASYPTYNPSVWSGGISENEFKSLFGTKDGEPILERATQGQYPPGSTFKVTTLTAGIKYGDSLYADYDCPAATDVGGHAFNNDFGNGGEMSLHQALVLSCDTVFYNMGLQIWDTDNRKYDTVTSPHVPVQFEQKIEMDWGFGKDTGIDLPGESNGTIPTREWLYYFWKDNAHTGQNWCKYGNANGSYVQQVEYDDCAFGNVWEPGQAIIASIGQGYVAVTPLQLANAYVALANGGKLYSPRIGEALISPTGKVQHINPPVIGHLPASKTTLAYIRSALAGVVTSGTAAGTFGGFPLGQVCIAAKTGTAQVFGKNSTSNFASFAPCDHPKYVVVMMIPDAGYGADASGPAVRKIWDAIYGLEGAKAATPHGVLPGLPRMNSAGQIIPAASGRAGKTR
jgi:penicillin-binding protein 2